jgi:hypothetical protein
VIYLKLVLHTGKDTIGEKSVSDLKKTLDDWLVDSHAQKVFSTDIRQVGSVGSLPYEFLPSTISYCELYEIPKEGAILLELNSSREISVGGAAYNGVVHFLGFEKKHYTNLFNTLQPNISGYGLK